MCMGMSTLTHETLMTPILPPPHPQILLCRGRLGYLQAWGTVPTWSGAFVPLTVTEQARTSSHAHLVSATKGCEDKRMTLAIPQRHQSLPKHNLQTCRNTGEKAALFPVESPSCKYRAVS